MKAGFQWLAVLFISVWLISAYAFIGQKDEAPEKHLEVVLREIGHQLLLQAGDSTSRVLPIRKIDENIYQISFQKDFGFVTDSLISLVHRRLEKSHTSKNYIVNIKDCGQKATIFAFEINAQQDNLLPCGGRNQEVGCYLIEINFLKTKRISFAFLMMMFIPMFFLGFYLKGKFWKIDHRVKIIDHGDLPQVGRYYFDMKKNMLYFKDISITLSGKEAKALQLFTEKPNQVIDRETLMKEIWEDEGTVVISRNVDVLVSKLRKKLSEDPSVKIINIHGRGYKFMM